MQGSCRGATVPYVSFYETISELKNKLERHRLIGAFLFIKEKIRTRTISEKAFTGKLRIPRKEAAAMAAEIGIEVKRI
jgi:hypothetical protein